MPYTCEYCEEDCESAHSVTVYEKDGLEERYQTLCEPCYEDWLLSLRG